jgi:hypothetical protein
MKKLIILLLAFVTMQVSSQSLESLNSKTKEVTKAKDATKELPTSSTSFIDKIAGDQVKKLTKKLNLSESQQSQVSDLVVSQLKSEKFSKLIGSLTPEKLLGSGDSKEVNSAKLTDALANDPDFKSGMDSILEDDQKAKLSALTPK